MKGKTPILLIIALALVLGSCTEGRWIVKDRSAIDTSDYKVLDQNFFLQVADSVKPVHPSLKLNLMSRTKYRYPKRVLVERGIQDYKLRPVFFALGMSGAALSFYAANATSIASKRSNTMSLTLNGLGVVLAASSILNLKPTGKPKSTKEQKYLRNIGDSVRVDTVRVQQQPERQPTFSITYGDLSIAEHQPLTFNENNTVTIPLAELLEDFDLEGPKPGKFNVTVNFQDNIYDYTYSVSDILEPYANITSRFAALRNSPKEETENIAADLKEGSKVRIKNIQSDNWYQVLYGISEHYIQKKNARIIWQPADFEQEDQIVSVPRIPFGEVDVEANIPIIHGKRTNAAALLISNQDYADSLGRRRYADRDAHLIENYLKDGLGYSSQKIFSIHDFKDKSAVRDTLSKIRGISNDSTQLTVFLSGYGEVSKLKSSSGSITMRGISSEGKPTQELNISDFLQGLSSITDGSTLVIADLDFSNSTSGRNFTSEEARRFLKAQVEPLTGNNSNSAIFFSTHLNQPSALYKTKQQDKRHYIFPYFFAKALQEQNTKLADINQYLRRNVSYTARKLHDHPQDPLLLGNITMDLQD